MRAGSIFAVLTLAGAVAGCVLVTGGSDGYTASQPSLSGETCHTPADCNGQPCCFELDDAGTPSTACQASCPAWEQSCGVASDCGDAGALPGAELLGRGHHGHGHDLRRDLVLHAVDLRRP